MSRASYVEDVPGTQVVVIAHGGTVYVEPKLSDGCSAGRSSVRVGSAADALAMRDALQRVAEHLWPDEYGETAKDGGVS